MGNASPPVPWVDFILVNYNGGSKIVDTITSIKHHCHKHLYTLTVVDNASSDESCDLIEQKHPEANIIKTNENHGFGKACNIGVAHTQSPYIVLINPDVHLQCDVIAIFEQFLQSHPIQPMPILGGLALGKNGKPEYAFERFPNCYTLFLKAIGLGRILNKTQSATAPIQVDNVSGSLLFIGRKQYQALKGFDDSFFLYFEETDLQFRARQQGILSYHIPDARYFHENGGTFTDSAFRRQCYQQGMATYLGKRYGKLGQPIFIVYNLLDNTTRPLRQLIKRALGEHKINEPQNQ